jgi:hypothetical protein
MTIAHSMRRPPWFTDRFDASGALVVAPSGASGSYAMPELHVVPCNRDFPLTPYQIALMEGARASPASERPVASLRAALTSGGADVKRATRGSISHRSKSGDTLAPCPWPLRPARAHAGERLASAAISCRPSKINGRPKTSS